MSHSPPSPSPLPRAHASTREWPTLIESLSPQSRLTVTREPVSAIPSSKDEPQLEETSRFHSSRSTDFLLEPPRSNSPTISQPTTPTPSFPFRSLSDSTRNLLIAPPPPPEDSTNTSRASSAPDEPTIDIDQTRPRRDSRDDPTKVFRGSPHPFFMPDLMAAQGSSHEGGVSTNPPRSSPSDTSVRVAIGPRLLQGSSEMPRVDHRDGENSDARRETNAQQVGSVGVSPTGDEETSTMRLSQFDADLNHLATMSFNVDSKVRQLIEEVNKLHHRVHRLEQAAMEQDRKYENLKHVVEVVHQQQRQENYASFNAPPRLSYSHASRDPYFTELTPPGTAHYSVTPSTNYSEESIPPSHRRTFSLPTRETSSQPQYYGHQSSLSADYAHVDESRRFVASRSPPLPPPPTQQQQQTPLRHFGPVTPAYLISPTTSSSPFDRQQPSFTASQTSPSGPLEFVAAPVPRRPSLAPLQTGSRSSSSGAWTGGTMVNSGGPRTNPEFTFPPAGVGIVNPSLSRSNSGQFPSFAAAPPAPRVVRDEGLNYRTLLDSDAEIDEEVFVRRIFLQNDQQCSLFLQQRVGLTSGRGKQRLLEAVGKYLIELSARNFLVSRCLEAGDLALAQSYSAALQDHFLELSLDPFACHVVQKLLDCSDQATKDRVVDELSPFPNTLMQKSSAHVWNRLLTQPNPPAFYRRLSETGKGIWANVVKDDGGSLIVQHLLEDWTETHTSIVARELLDGLEEVATTACGSFVLVSFIDKNALPFRARVLELAPRLATDTFGAKVVERVLKTGRVPPAAMASFIDAITTIESGSCPLLLTIASHVSGAALLSHILTTSIAPFTDKAKLVRCIAAHQRQLLVEGGAHAAKLVTLIEKPSGGAGGNGG